MAIQSGSPLISSPVCGSPVGPHALPSSAVTPPRPADDTPLRILSAPPAILSNNIDYKYTTSVGIQETLKLLYEFQLLMKRVINGSTESMPVFSLEEHNQLFNELAEKDIRKVKDKRTMVETIASRHIKLLLNYNTYLRGVLEEIAKANLAEELSQVELLLKGRNLKSEGELSSSPLKTPGGLFSTSHEVEPPAAIKDSWSTLRQLAELKVELAALKSKFAFVANECPDDLFAQEYRQDESVRFLTKFKEIKAEPPAKSETFKDQCLSAELNAVTRCVVTCHQIVQRELKEISFIPTEVPTGDLSARVTGIAKEFEINSGVFFEVEKFRSLSKAITVLRESIVTENNFEYLRENGVRKMFHQRNIHELTRLRAEIGDIEISRLIEGLSGLMQKALKASTDISQMFSTVQRTMELFDEKIKRKEPTSSDVK